MDHLNGIVPNQSLMTITVWLVIGGLLCVFLLAAGAELWRLLKVFLSHLGPFIWKAGVGTVRGLIFVLQFFMETLATALLVSLGPLCRHMKNKAQKVRQKLRLARVSALHADDKEAGDEEVERNFPTDSGRLEGDPVEPVWDDGGAAMRQAVEVLGLTLDQASDLRKVNQRYRELMAIVSPERGFANALFAQQVTEARDVIKREIGAD